jgi:hypothetical protein
MPTYEVRYARTDYYTKQYEADSYDDAEEMFDNDPDKWDDMPGWSDEEYVEIIETENGNA